MMTYKNLAKRTVDFGMADAKGRAIGALVTTYDATHDGSGSHGAGTFLAAYVTPTRNGEPFGSSSATAEFSNEAERDAFIASRVAASRARYARKF